MAAATRARQRPHCHFALLQTGENFRRGTDNVEIVQVQVVHVGRGIEIAQGAVQVQRRRAEGYFQALGRHHLHDVPRQHVVLDAIDHIGKLRLAEMGAGTALQGTGIGAVEGHFGQGRHRLAQLVGQGPQARPGLRQSLRPRRVGIDDDADGAGQVVEHQHLLRQHQQDVRIAQLVRWRPALQLRLYVAHAVIAKIAHQTTVEDGQFRLRGHPEAALKRLHKGQGILDLVGLGDLAIDQDLHPVVMHPQQGAAGQTDDRVAAPLLTALDRLEEVGKRPLPPACGTR